jgi:hypothetical protein
MAGVGAPKNAADAITAADNSATAAVDEPLLLSAGWLAA